MRKKLFFSAIVLPALITAQNIDNSNSPLIEARGQGVRSDTISVKNLEEVIVTSTRNVGARLIAPLLNSAQLQQQNTGQNLPFLLSATPSLVVTSDDGLGVGYTYFRVRGTDHTRINMTINGVPLNDSESQTVFWVNMTDFASSLQNVQVQRGVGTSTNGSSAFGASVNMLTDNSTEKPYATLHFNGGMYRTFREMIKVGTGVMPSGFAFDARFSKVNSDGYLERAKSDLYSYSVSGGWYGKQTLVKLLAFGGKERTYMAWDGVSAEQLEKNRRFNPAGADYEKDINGNDSIAGFYKNQTDNYAQNNFQLHFAHICKSVWGATWTFNAALHYTKGVGFYEQFRDSINSKFSSYSLPTYFVGTQEIKRADIVRRKNLDNDFYGLIGSVNYKYLFFNATLGGGVSNYSGAHFGNVIYVKNYPLPLEKDFEYYRNTGKKFDANVYLKANYRIVPFFNIFADLQYRRVNYSIGGINADGLQPIPVLAKFDFFNPKFGINFSKNGHNTDFSFAVANREPSRSNYTENSVNAIPMPERLFDYELGYNFQHKIFTIGANLYFMQYKNQLVLTGKYSDTGKALTHNVEKSYRAGVEFVGGVEFAKWLRWDLNLTLSQNKIFNYADWVDDWTSGGQIEINYGNTDISFSPNITAGSVLHFNLKGIFADFQTNFVGSQFLDNTNNAGAKLKPYCVNNLVVGYNVFETKNKEQGTKIVKGIILKLQINNIFNAKYVSNGWAYSYFESADAGGNYLPANQKYDNGYFAQAGINIHGGITVEF